MIYADTGRAAWNRTETLFGFFGTAALLGSGLAGVLLLWLEFFDVQDPTIASAKRFCVAATLIRTALFGYGCWRDRQARTQDMDPMHRSVRLLDRSVPWLSLARWVLFGMATLTAGLSFIVSQGLAPVAATLSLFLTFVAQGLERWTFFVGCAPQRMPGLPR
jgi:DMSO reductase anchor subunit